MTPRGCCEHGHAAEQEPPVGDQPCLVPGGRYREGFSGIRTHGGHWAHRRRGELWVWARGLVRVGPAEGRGAGRECTPVVSGRGSSAVGPCQNVKVGGRFIASVVLQELGAWGKVAVAGAERRALGPGGASKFAVSDTPAEVTNAGAFPVSRRVCLLSLGRRAREDGPEEDSAKEASAGGSKWISRLCKRFFWVFLEWRARHQEPSQGPRTE